MRIGELGRIASLVKSDDTQQSHTFRSESEKLKVIRDVVRWQNFRFFSRKVPEFCTQFLEVFSAGENIQAVEPQFRTNDKNDPRFKEFNDCKTKPFPEGVGPGSFYYVSILGGPPYRYYEIELDGNETNGKEDVIYHEFHPDSEGTSGYTWVNIGEEKCTAVNRVGLSSWGSLPRDAYRMNAIVRYKQVPLAVSLYPFFSRSTPTKYRFQAEPLIDAVEPRLCAWKSHVIEKERTEYAPGWGDEAGDNEGRRVVEIGSNSSVAKNSRVDVCEFVLRKKRQKSLTKIFERTEYLRSGAFLFDISKYVKSGGARAVLVESVQGTKFNLYMAFTKVKLAENGVLLDESTVLGDMIEGADAAYFFLYKNAPFVLTKLSNLEPNVMENLYSLENSKFERACR